MKLDAVWTRRLQQISGFTLRWGKQVWGSKKRIQLAAVLRSRHSWAGFATVLIKQIPENMQNQNKLIHTPDLPSHSRPSTYTWDIPFTFQTFHSHLRSSITLHTFHSHLRSSTHTQDLPFTLETVHLHLKYSIHTPDLPFTLETFHSHSRPSTHTHTYPFTDIGGMNQPQTTVDGMSQP